MRRKYNLHQIAIEAGRRTEDVQGRAWYSKVNVQEKEGIRRAHGHAWICQLDNLGAVYRWLRSKVGKPWNKVNALICEELGKPLDREHIKSHIEGMVERYPSYDKKKRPCHADRWHAGRLICKDAFYVDRGGHLREGRYTHFQKWSSQYPNGYKDPGIIKDKDRLIYVTEHGKFTSYLIPTEVAKNTKCLVRPRDTKEQWKFSKTIPKGYEHVLGPFKQYTA
tara:strand:- start:18713 stop:19378 length:666 start_codon:yes stop_codon:yes gene_type:complete